MSLQESSLPSGDACVVTRRNRGALQIALQVLAGVTVAAFVVCGAATFKAAMLPSADLLGPLGSTDAMLGEISKVDRTGEKILDSIAGLAPSQPIAIVTPPSKAVFGGLLKALISSFTWPHQIFQVQAAAGTMGYTMGTLRSDHFGAALFYGIRPALPDDAIRQIGTLTVVILPK